MARTRRVNRAAGEAGFTLMELVMAVTIIGLVFVSLAYVLMGSLGAISAARQRSAFVEIANAELEAMRSLPYDRVGVRSDDPNLSTSYGTPPEFEGKDAVVVPSNTVTPAAIQTVTSSPMKGVVLPYTVRRWVTWADTSGGDVQQFKQLTVVIEWSESREADRSFRLSSILYPGDVGPHDPTNNHPAISAYGYTPAAPVEAGVTDVTFTASASDPNSGDTLTYTWNFGDGSAPIITSSNTTTYRYPNPGTFTTTLVVTDGRGGSANASDSIFVFSASGNSPPTNAQMSATPTTGTAPLEVLFSGSADDPEGDDLAYSWDFGDGNSGSGPTAAHTYGAVVVPTSYTVTLTVIDTVGGGVALPKPQTTITVLPLDCAIDTGAYSGYGGEFQQQNNPTKNDVIVNHQGRVHSSRSVISFTVQTTAACGSVAARLPVTGGTLAVQLSPVTGAPGGYQLWSGSVNLSNQTSFDLGQGANRTWDIWTPSADGSTDTSSPVFTVTVS